MNSFLLIVFLSTVAVVVAVEGPSSPAAAQLHYWNTVLRMNAPMPPIIEELLRNNLNTSTRGSPWRATSVTPNRLQYVYVPSESEMHDDPSMDIFFLEEDLHPGTKMTLQFKGLTTTSTRVAFLPRHIANSIPFSSAKLPEILNHFSFDPDSIEAKSMKMTLRECEARALSGERKHCATSLESMVEFCTSSLGTHDVQAVSTLVDKEGAPRQSYTVVSSSSGIHNDDDQMVVCHAEAYPYAVFYCHAMRGSKAFDVKMVGEDGAKVEAVAICHTDTAGWNPKHVAFRVLKVKPGTLPICHFLPQDHLVWGRNNFF